jgi:hypothetical protein
VKEIKAYYCAWVYPPKEPYYATLSIQYTDQTRKEILRIPLEKGEHNDESETILARAILEHHFGVDITDNDVDELVNLPGHSLCRIEPADLFRFATGRLWE